MDEVARSNRVGSTLIEPTAERRRLAFVSGASYDRWAAAAGAHSTRGTSPQRRSSS
jgi:hypothetical protein